MLRLRLNNLEGSLGFDGILNHGPKLVIVEAIRFGYHGMVFLDLVLPVEEVSVGRAAPVSVVDTRRGDMGEELAGIEAGSSGFQQVVT